jgi:anti-sigma regulatory factor (Ser/Thr protein kinase)
MSSPPQTMVMAFEAAPQAAGEARAFTAAVLHAWDLSHHVETAELLVSELITNAVKHAGVDIPPVILSVSCLDALLVQVWDASSEPVVRRAAAGDDIGGRGLDLVDALAKEWGCDVLETGGKVVWFAIDLDVRDDR